ncbi:MAG: N-acetyl-gamma-glutamyl-phosphate reductase, partial [Pyrinomonadaceae bacterium]
MGDERKKIRAAIVGGSGYGGSELLRILLFHPYVEVTLTTANEHVGKQVASVHQNLRGLTGLVFDNAPTDYAEFTETDVVFFALPHGEAMKAIPSLPVNVKAIDISGDFRIDDAKIFERFYKLDH